MKLNDIISSFLLANSDTEIEKTSQQLKEYEKTASLAEKEAIKATVDAKTKMMLQEADKLLRATDDFLSKKGRILDLNEWVTLKVYSQRFGLANTNVVSNWIKRGVVPAENLITVPELNNLRLIKSVKYH